jgi:hypothetical protein
MEVLDAKCSREQRSRHQFKFIRISLLGFGTWFRPSEPCFPKRACCATGLAFQNWVSTKSLANECIEALRNTPFWALTKRALNRRFLSSICNANIRCVLWRVSWDWPGGDADVPIQAYSFDGHWPMNCHDNTNIEIGKHTSSKPAWPYLQDMIVRRSNDQITFKTMILTLLK